MVAYLRSVQCTVPFFIPKTKEDKRGNLGGNQRLQGIKDSPMFIKYIANDATAHTAPLLVAFFHETVTIATILDSLSSFVKNSPSLQK